MYDDYITTYSDKYSHDTAQFTFGSPDAGSRADIPMEDWEEQVFIGAMREMVKYIFERSRDDRVDDENMSLREMLAPENLENVYISNYPYSAPVVVTEYAEVPAWFTMENAELREFYWHPNPYESGEWNAAYFQPRHA